MKINALRLTNCHLTQDVVISCGGSGALEMAISVLCNAGQNILLPKPLFPLYETLASSKKVESRFYSLLVKPAHTNSTSNARPATSPALQPDHDWEADLKEMESLIDDKTAAILVNNPSNPCGSVYSKVSSDQTSIPSPWYLTTHLLCRLTWRQFWRLLTVTRCQSFRMRFTATW